MSSETEEIERVLEGADQLVAQAEVEAALDRMAANIEQRLSGQNPLLLCVMTGGLIVSSELFTRLQFPVQLDYLHATRYQGTKGGRVLKWITRPSQDLKGRTLLVVDDILDEGLTLAAILEYCREQGVLVEKIHERKPDDLRADFVGLRVEDRYLFGYGMDYHGYLRNLKGIYAVAE